MNETNIEQPITDVNSSTLQYFKRHPWEVLAYTVSTIVLAFCGVMVAMSGPQTGGDSFVLFFIAVIIPIAGYSTVKQHMENEFMKQFAEANGYTLLPNGNLDMPDGTLFRLGNGYRLASDTITGKYLGSPITLFYYRYQTGAGKTRAMHYYTVFELQFDTPMPDMLLEKKDIFSSDILLGQLPERIKLEGDFNKYFSLSIKKGYEIEALEIFTPDVMAELESKCESFSLEIVNNHLFVYDNKTVGTKTELDALYGAVQYFVQTLGPVLARMKAPTEAMEAAQQQ